MLRYKGKTIEFSVLMPTYLKVELGEDPDGEESILIDDFVFESDEAVLDDLLDKPQIVGVYINGVYSDYKANSIQEACENIKRVIDAVEGE